MPKTKNSRKTHFASFGGSMLKDKAKAPRGAQKRGSFFICFGSFPLPNVKRSSMKVYFPN